MIPLFGTMPVLFYIKILVVILPGTRISDDYAAGHTGFSARCADLFRVLNSIYTISGNK